jgi:hypothetical protein
MACWEDSQPDRYPCGCNGTPHWHPKAKDTPMTDDEIKAIVTKYIVEGFEDDNADCLHEMDEFDALFDYLPDGSVTDTPPDFKRAYEFYLRAKVTVTFE